jgi:hypothetical protein
MHINFKVYFSKNKTKKDIVTQDMLERKRDELGHQNRKYREEIIKLRKELKILNRENKFEHKHRWLESKNSRSQKQIHTLLANLN